MLRFTIELAIVLCVGGVLAPTSLVAKDDAITNGLFFTTDQPDNKTAPRLGQLIHENARSLPSENRSRNLNGFWEFVRAMQKDMREMTGNEACQSMYQMAFRSTWLNNWAAAAPTVTDTSQTWRDLELFAGKPDNAQKYIVNALHRTQTPFGFFSQQMLLAFPAQTMPALHARQNVVSALTTNTELLADIRAHLQSLQTAQIPLFRMSESYDSLNNALRWSHLYDTGATRWLNKYAPALFASTTYQRLMSIMNTGKDMMFTGALILYGFYALKNWQCGDKVRGWGLGAEENVFNRQTGANETAQERTEEVHGNASNTSNWVRRYAWRWCKHPVIHAGMAWGTAYLYVYGLRDSIRRIIAAQILRNTLHEVMCKIAHLMRSAQTIYNKTKDIKAFRANAELAPFYSFFEEIVLQDADMKEFITLLHTSTFDEASDFIPAHTGRLIRAQQIFASKKPLLRSLFLSLGFLDAYASIATLYNEHQDTPVQFCLPRFIEQTAPAITLNGVWHPFVAADTAIPNDFMLGSLPAHREAIITGPNTAGKSTLLKSVALSALMAQGWGIAPASAITMTPFSIIETYLNISDDTAEGNSLFKQEVIRANQLLQRIKGLPAGQHALVFFDEMYSGTSPKESVACAYSTAQHLAQQEQALSMVATHFELLTELPQYFPHAGNYRMTVQRTRGGGQFRCPFKVEQGVSHDHVALDVLAQEGVDADILRTAREVLLRQ